VPAPRAAASRPYPLELSRNHGIPLSPLLSALVDFLSTDTGTITKDLLVGWKAIDDVRAFLGRGSSKKQGYSKAALKQLACRLRNDVLKKHGQNPLLIQTSNLDYRLAVRCKGGTSKHENQ
jgi:hypothetical protein